MNDLIAVDTAPVSESRRFPKWLKDMIQLWQAVPYEDSYLPEWIPAPARQILAGREWGEFGEVMTIDERRIEAFAFAVEDFQPIHLDEEAAQQGPFRGRVAHGDLTTSLDTKLISEFALFLEHFTVIRVYKACRLLRPVPLGSQVRMRMRITSTFEHPKVQKGIGVLYEFEVQIKDTLKTAVEGGGHLICTRR